MAAIPVLNLAFHGGETIFARALARFPVVAQSSVNHDYLIIHRRWFQNWIFTPGSHCERMIGWRGGLATPRVGLSVLDQRAFWFADYRQGYAAQDLQLIDSQFEASTAEIRGILPYCGRYFPPPARQLGKHPTSSI